MAKYTNLDAKIRIYDANNLYLQLELDSADFSGPLGRKRPAENLVLNRGRADAHMHNVKGNDEPIYEPLSLSFTFQTRNDQQTINFRNLLRACSDGAATQVNGNTLVTTKGTTQNDGSNNNPAFADTSKIALNVEYLKTKSTSEGRKYAEVWFPLDQCTESEGEDGINWSISGEIYGTITDLTGFTSGTDMEA